MSDQVRVLSELSGRVVGALLDETTPGRDDDAFSDARRRYREEGSPDGAAVWRTILPAGAAIGARAAAVLRHLTRDLLEQVSLTHDAEGQPADGAPEAPPSNVHAITDARDVPALELASDGTWRPSTASVSSRSDLEAGARHRANVPSLSSRYPELERSDQFPLPPPRQR